MQLRQNTKIRLKQEHNSTGIKRYLCLYKTQTIYSNNVIGQNQNLFVNGAASASTACLFPKNKCFFFKSLTYNNTLLKCHKYFISYNKTDQRNA